jgi:hypothetical protein
MKKPGLAIVLGGSKAEGDDDEDIEVSPEEVEAASAVRAAGDDEEYAKALKAFVKMCGDY